jgi:hypothetical protein
MNKFHQGPSVTSRQFNIPLINISKEYNQDELIKKISFQIKSNYLIQNYFGISKKKLLNIFTTILLENENFNFY